MLVRCCFNYLAEMQQLVKSWAIHEVSQSLAPTVFEFNQNFNQLGIVLKLGIHNFNIHAVFL